MESAGHHPKAARCPGARPAALLLSLTASLIWEGLKVNGQEMARTDMRSTSVAVSDSPLHRNSSPGIKGSCKEGYFFFTQCGKCAGESPQVLTGQLPTRLASLIAFCCISSLLCSPPTTSRYFPSVAATR